MRADGVRGVRKSQAASAFLFSALWALLLMVGCNADQSNSAHKCYDDCEVTSVADGDTVNVQCGGIPDKVRLLRIDTVERGEPGYVEARTALEDMIGDGPVKLVFETPEKVKRGSYNRLLAYLFVDGRNLNVEMVRACWSYFYTKYGEGRFVDDFLQAESDCSRKAKYPTLQSSGFVGPCDKAFVRALDGDTVHVSCPAGEFYEVQLLRSDGPERNERGVKNSRRALREMLVGREIRFLPEEEGGEATQDKHDRWLSYLQDVESGKIINVEMVRGGHACYDTGYGKGRFADDFAAAQAECNADKRCRARSRCEQGESDQ